MQIMNECPDHWAWQRHRYVHHGGVDRDLISNLWNSNDNSFFFSFQIVNEN